MGNESTERFIIRGDRNRNRVTIDKIPDRRRGIHQQAAVLQALHGFFLGVVLVLDLPHDFLDQIFQRDQALDTTVFVDGNSHMNSPPLHLLQQDADFH